MLQRGPRPLSRPPLRQVPLSEEEQAAAAAKPDKFAIGVEGGFNVDAKKYKVETDWVSGSGRCTAASGVVRCSLPLLQGPAPRRARSRASGMQEAGCATAQQTEEQGCRIPPRRRWC